MDSKALVKRMQELSAITDQNERFKEDEKFLSYLDGVIANEKDITDLTFLINLYFTLQIRLSTKQEINHLNKKFDDLQPTINNILGKIGQLEKRFNDLDEGK